MGMKLVMEKTRASHEALKLGYNYGVNEHFGVITDTPTLFRWFDPTQIRNSDQLALLILADMIEQPLKTLNCCRK